MLKRNMAFDGGVTQQGELNAKGFYISDGKTDETRFLLLFDFAYTSSKMTLNALSELIRRRQMSIKNRQDRNNKKKSHTSFMLKF